MNCVETLRAAASVEPVQDKRYMLQATAALLQAAIDYFTAAPTTEALQNLNGVWAYAWRVLQIATPQPEGTGGGRLPNAQAQQVA